MAEAEVGEHIQEAPGGGEVHGGVAAHAPHRHELPQGGLEGVDGAPRVHLQGLGAPRITSWAWEGLLSSLTRVTSGRSEQASGYLKARGQAEGSQDPSSDTPFTLASRLVTGAWCTLALAY